MAPSAMKAMKAMKAMQRQAAAKAVAKAETKKATVPVGGLTQKEVGKVKAMNLDQKLAFFKDKLGTTTDLTIENLGEFQGLLTKLDKSTLWSRHQTYLRNHPEEKVGQEGLGKKEKGLQTLAICMDKGGAITAFVKNKLIVSKTHEQVQKWMPWTHFASFFGDVETQAHYESGRLMEREDPLTPGIFEYQDRGDITVKKSIRTSKVKAEDQKTNVDADYELLDDLMKEDIV